MTDRLREVKLLGLRVAFAVGIAAVGSQIPRDTNPRYEPISAEATKQVFKDFIDWEVTRLPPKLFASSQPDPDIYSPESLRFVRDFLAQPDKDPTQAPLVERIIERQIETILDKEEVPKDRPPVRFSFTSEPNSLVVAPKDKIEIRNMVPLMNSLDESEKGNIEKKIESSPPDKEFPNGKSAIVIEAGGFGFTDPTAVDSVSHQDIYSLLKTVSHEWMHRYLGLSTLGKEYVLTFLKIRNSPEGYRLNETVADVVGDSLRDKVIQEFYAGKVRQISRPSQSQSPGEDFSKELRDLKGTIDETLGRGELSQAEQLMEEKKEELNSKGANIRKMNPAYLAFMANYALMQPSSDLPPPEVGEQPQPRPAAPRGPSLTDLLVNWRDSSKNLGQFITQVKDISTEREVRERIFINKPIVN